MFPDKIQLLYISIPFSRYNINTQINTQFKICTILFCLYIVSVPFLIENAHKNAPRSKIIYKHLKEKIIKVYRKMENKT